MIDEVPVFQRNGLYVQLHLLEERFKRSRGTQQYCSAEKCLSEISKGYLAQASVISLRIPSRICPVRFNSVQPMRDASLKTMANDGRSTRLLEEPHEETSIQPIDRPFVYTPGE